VELARRASKVALQSLGRPHRPGGSFRDFWQSLPRVLAAQDLRAVARAVLEARAQDRPVLLGMGAHPIKVGLSPVIIKLLQEGLITALATNGAAIVHDFELAYAGQTSEDVAEELQKGTFGMARETGRYLNECIKEGLKDGLGLGEAVGRFIARHRRMPYRDKSIFAACWRLGLPATVHVALGTDVIHMHPWADGAALGEASLKDFRLFASVVSDLRHGVYINLGSAVLMPEVFLKALTLARNLGHKVEPLTTVNMDFIQHYRARVNVLARPTIPHGRAYALTGHHEIMLPLLAAALLEGLK